MANIFNIKDKNILATASITITDQTDAATLAGGISVISGSKNQVYLTGTATPFSPDWTKHNLVLRPHLLATSIVRSIGTVDEYNPDLFDPNEYPDLSKPNGSTSSPYIDTNYLHWYYRDSSGVETLINPDTDSNFSFTYTTNDVTFTDKRYLVIKKNFVPKDTFITIICKFSFYDPFAKVLIKQTYEVDLSCLSTGLGTNQLVINSVNGTSIYNSHPNYIDLYCSYFKNGVEVDIQDEIERSDKSSILRWYIRSGGGDGWVLLDGTKQDEGESYEYTSLFEIHRHTHYDNDYDIYITEPTLSSRGGFLLRVHPALITGSNVIKAVFEPSDENVKYNALEIVNDMTDDVQAFIHSSNGDKIYQGIESIGTTLTCMVKYHGELMTADNSKYDNFDYYWFRVSADGTETLNMWVDSTGKVNFTELTEDYTDLKSSSRVIHIDSSHVDNVNTFQCAVVDKVKVANEELRTNIITNSPSEDDIIAASLLLAQLGIEEDADEILNTAYEINATNIENGNSFIN